MSLYTGFISLPGGPEWLVIFVIILIVFGPKNLPKIGKAIGQGMREFKNASDGITRAIEEEVSAAEREEQARKEREEQEKKDREEREKKEREQAVATAPAISAPEPPKEHAGGEVAPAPKSEKN
jgi:sec-independent protein translocase protein TatA